jgi:hypothetical protein
MRGIRISHFRDLKIFPQIKKRLFIWRMACDSCQKCGRRVKKSHAIRQLNSLFLIRGKIFRSRKCEIGLVSLAHTHLRIYTYTGTSARGHWRMYICACNICAWIFANGHLRTDICACNIYAWTFA